MNPTTAFDADVLIYAAAKDHPLGTRVAELFADAEAAAAVGVGSVLLLTEVLAKPMRDDPDSDECAALLSLLSRLELRPLDEPTARLSLALAVSYGLRAADAAHLATAVAAGVDRFLTNNRRDFPRSIAEIDIVYPDDLPAVERPSDLTS
ncbi:PIN domain-containing protein [Mycolicibacterium phocaicum]|uniref:PIN domain-containing protein n=1 Tax=Mycolicibacterium phocaicum TaxID=319706 RepID=UPI000926CF4C|nr:PIN domain-containing protein [Mycolicibacterium phocaicum]UCZ62885.1 PIN domain-containing protein [Mycolicibacterium phocaicum]SHV84953.1 PIN domain [Mycobacteroides abscessus subsp. abscessus]